MSCRRAFETDLLAVLHGEGTDPEFVRHYPECPECGAEVEVWRELDAMLRAGAATTASHPTAEALLAFVDTPATIGVAARGEVERHLESCRACAEEVRTLRAFDATRLVAGGVGSVVADVERGRSTPYEARSSTAAGSRGAAPSTRERSDERHGGWLGRLVWHPAFAYALVVLLLVRLVRDQLPRIAGEPRVVDARRDARPATAPVEQDGTRGERPASPPALASTRADTDVQTDAPRPAPNGAAPVEARRPLAQAPAGMRPPPPELLAEDEGAPSLHDLAGELPPEAKARSADETSTRRMVPRETDESAKTAAAGRLEERARLEESARREAPVAGAAVGRDQKPLVIALESNAPTTVAAGIGDAGAIVRVVAPPDLAPGPLDVTVHARAGARELHTRVTDRAHAIEVTIPPRWLVPGDYAVTLTPVEPGPGRAHEPAIFGFTVRAPTAR